MSGEPKKTLLGRASRFLKVVYLKLFRINDAPYKIALGFGLGVFCGVLPFTGPIAALALALFFSVNRASALLGSVITNTWLSIPVFILSVKIGSMVTGYTYEYLYDGFYAAFRGFSWDKLIDPSLLFNFILPVMLGYLLVSLCIALVCYLVIYIVIKFVRSRSNPGSPGS